MAAKRKTKKKAGAPSKLTEANILAILSRFRDGATNLEAIEGIFSEDTYYEHIKKNTEFAARVDMAKEYITEIARGVVAKRVKRGDPEIAKWWLERRNKAQFSTKTEVENSGEQKVTVEIKKYSKEG